MLRDILTSVDPVAALRALDAKGKLGEIEPSLAALRMNIPKGYNHKDNLTHSIQVLENAIARETHGADIILRTAALFHDIAKPATRAFHGKGNVTFDGHEAVGAKMIYKILSRHGYSKSEVNEIATLIAYHMRSHGFTPELWTDSAIRRLIVDVGNVATLERLFVIFYSDVTSKIPGKREKLHAGVDKLMDAIENVRLKDKRQALRPALDGIEIMRIFALTPSRELGAVMKFLNSDEGVSLSREDAISEIKERFALTTAF